MPRIALVTARVARGTDYDMPPLLAALNEAGAAASEVDWDDDTVDWSRFDLALLRSTWDYCERLPAFLDWARRVSTQTSLLNPLDVIRWNTDKHYLQHLANAGVPVVPSRFVEPGGDPDTALDALLAAHPATHDIVVKPAVGAGSRDAQRHARTQRDAIVAHLRRLLGAGRSVLIQPYLDRVDEQGETALLFFDGAFSHAIRKGPLLQRNAGPTGGLYAEETITPRTPSVDERALARHALEAIPFPGPRLYARVDLIHDDDGTPRLLELELVEPSFFAAHAEGAADRFARAILGHTRS
jgi:glutathione synthase/RimK-type ligase-like ATP-grasp enzyme